MKSMKGRGKVRIDTLLLKRGLAESRHKAQALVLSGVVFVDGKRIEKAGASVDEEADLVVKTRGPQFVSRGGTKLEHVLDHFPVDVHGKIALDVGASTGGFTDCLLKRGAEKIYAVDVGSGQLDYSLRNDSRVVIMEGVNARFLTGEMFPDPINIATIDTSFISLKLILPRVFEVLSSGGDCLALIKPQFEVGKGEVGKGGVVRDPVLHRRVIDEIREFALSLGSTVQGVEESPLKGPKGNREFFIYLHKVEGARP